MEGTGSEFKLLKSDNVIHNINSVKKKSNMIYQLIQEKPLATFEIHHQKKKKLNKQTKTSHYIINRKRTSSTLGNIYKTLTTNIILNGKQWIFPPKRGNKSKISLSLSTYSTSKKCPLVEYDEGVNLNINNVYFYLHQWTTRTWMFLKHHLKHLPPSVIFTHTNLTKI